jgi:4-amino-4-deoxy-L-arabinose transferase-like glycosyltransferase
MIRTIWLATVLVVGIAVVARVTGPSDLYDNDQPDTMSYTADIVLNGQWALPRNMVGGPAHKPPLYNWIGWPLLKAGFWSEPALKMPSLLAGAVTLVVTVMMGRTWPGAAGRTRRAGWTRASRRSRSAWSAGSSG